MQVQRLESGSHPGMSRCAESSLHQIRRRFRRGISLGRVSRVPPVAPHEPGLAHQARHPIVAAGCR